VDSQTSLSPDVHPRHGARGVKKRKAISNTPSHVKCGGCNRMAGAKRLRDGVVVDLCNECFADFFRRERVFTEARGEKWDPAVAGRGNQ
jgi:hypothetical protein